MRKNIQVNCRYYSQGKCDKKPKFLGLFKRSCDETISIRNCACSDQFKFQKPTPSPALSKKRILKEDIKFSNTEIEISYNWIDPIIDPIGSIKQIQEYLNNQLRKKL